VLDSRGAVATSWVIKRNKETGRPLYAISEDKDRRDPLELIPSEKIRQNQAPLRLATGREDLDAALNTRNYQLVGLEGDNASSRLEVNPGESKRVEFKLTDPATGIEATKSLIFFADSYIVNLETRLTQNGQPLPNAKIAIGPNIGDQGVKEYTFYSVAPEGVGVAGGEVLRLYASSIAEDSQSPNVSNVRGPADWAGVGDTYFAMALVLPRPIEGLVYRTEKYTHPDVPNNSDDKFLITGYLPVPTDGSTMYLYTGPKDHDQLQAVSAEISKNLAGRQIDLEELINYGWTGRITRPLAAPILWSLKHLNRLTGSYGVAIILFTIIIYTLFFPLKWRSSKSMKKAQKLAPRMKELQEKIKGMKQNDPRLKELQMEQFRLMKEGNPLGGCLPILIQMPFLIALYSAITISIDFRQTSFLWMPDLSAGDPIRLLPILMAGSMVVLQLITPAPSADPLQRKMMAVIMPLMMLYILWSAPAGLLVYWLVGNLVGFGQQVLINRLIKSEDDEEPQPPEKNKAGTKPNNGTKSKKKLNEPRVSQA
jgi:YidC/Oxa1 family membrane protein insertase